MKIKLGVFVLAASLMAFGQGRGQHGMGQGMGQGPGMGQGAGMGQGPMMGEGGSMDRGQSQGQMGRSQGRTNHGGMSAEQQPLRDAQINGGAFRMLESKTGMTADQLKALYASSGARNFGQFVSAIVVSKNLNLDTNKVLAGLKTQSLGKTLQSLGVDQKTAKAGIKKANQQVKDAQAGKS